MSHTVRNLSVEAAHKAVQAVKMRLAKHTYEEIAQTIGYSNGGAAYNAVKREMNRRIVDSIDELRHEEGLALDAMQQNAMVLALGKPCDLAAIDRVLHIMERRAKLLGLDIKPEDQVQNTNYTKTIILQNTPAALSGND